MVSTKFWRGKFSRQASGFECIAHAHTFDRGVVTDVLIEVLCDFNTDLKIRGRDILGRLPEVNLTTLTCAQEVARKCHPVLLSSRTPFRLCCRPEENVSIFFLF